MRQCAGLLPLPLAAYNLCCVRRDGGRIDATPALQIGRLYWELGSAHEKSAASIASRSRFRLDVSREPDRISIACPGGHVGTTNNSKACRRLSPAVDRLRLVPGASSISSTDAGWSIWASSNSSSWPGWIPAIRPWTQSIVRNWCDRVA